MKLRPIQIGEAEAATILLAEGFPGQRLEVWRSGLTKLLAHAQAMGETSVGQIVSAGGSDVGVCLAIPSLRSAYTGAPRKIVNFASLYMRPGYEWMTTPLMRRLMADQTVEYTDLTASASMREINRRFGFADYSQGSLLIPLALAALRPARGARIVPLGDIPPGALPSEHRLLLEQHAALGCMAVGLYIDGTCHPLILVRTRRRGVPVAQMVLARDRELVHAGLGPIARYLLKRRLPLLMFADQSREGFPEALFWRNTAPIQSTRKPETATIDYTFSELVFFQPE